MKRPTLKWLAATLLAVLALPLLAALWVSVFGWNWARGPLQDLTSEKTGRELRIAGDLDVSFAWPVSRVRAQAVTFANPAWATATQMVDTEVAEIDVDLRQLLRGRLAFPEVRFTRPRVFLEQASGGRKTWLLDREQTDESKPLPIGHVLLDRGEVTYIDASRHTAIHAELSTLDAPAAGADPGSAARTLVFKATGQLQGEALAAHGSGGAVLAWLDESRPYPLQVKATLGRTQAQAEGSVTSLLEFTAVDLQLALKGDSLDSLFPVIGLVLPPTPAYRTEGRLVRSGALWRYEKFAGRVGRSDLAGTLQVDTSGTRPLLSGAVASRRLDLADLGPAVGARPSTPAGAAAKGQGNAARPVRVLPDLPFDTARWVRLDADVELSAATLLRDEALPLENLKLRLLLQDRRLTLDPLEFGLAGGKMKGQVTLDSRAEPLRGTAKVQLRGVKLGRLLPTVDLGKASIGQLNGDIELSGHGASVGRMLATADGRLSLVAENGEISRLLMEQVGLHLLEILQLKLTGDETVRLHCAVADFDVAGGVMEARALVLDTAVNTVIGSGRIDLRQETFDLTVESHTKVTSLVALRSPINVKGSFDKPVVELDTGRIAARGAGALLLGLLNPLLALVPLFESGPGADSDCAKLVRDARAAGPKTGP